MDVGKVPNALLVPAQAGSTPGLPSEPGLSSFDEEHPAAAPILAGEATNRSKLNDVIADLHTRMQYAQRDLSFSVDDSTGDVVVKVIDGESGKVVRQIPSEEILRLSERLDDIRSLLFDTTA
ncbi:flagellar protein FlaG [Pseudomonas sp. Q2-TVG4-2]|jgi:flagellar protein FlaG|uniref:flagellar protein FlaG n=1 Tax=Pseudomonas sp. Q2-TVG4-2 TaxID=1685699 RepID=UPI0015E7D962|nr:flagellar protein FlaG [Pseudomonas sp. Q2-TVG4-2]